MFARVRRRLRAWRDDTLRDFHCLTQTIRCWRGRHVPTVITESTDGIDLMCGWGSQRVVRCDYCKKDLEYLT